MALRHVPTARSSPSRGCRQVSGEDASTTNAIERLHEEFKRRIKPQTVLPAEGTAAMLALLASGQINMRKIDRWTTLAKAHRSTD